MHRRLVSKRQPTTKTKQPHAKNDIHNNQSHFQNQINQNIFHKDRIRRSQRIQTILRVWKRFRRNFVFLGVVGGLSIMCIYCVSSFIASISMRSRSHKIRIPSSSRTPITVACYFDVVKIGQHNSITDINADKATVSIPSRITRVRKLPIYDEDKYPSKRQMEEWTEKQTLSQAQLRDSRKYRSNTPENEHEHSTDANANYNADADCQIRHTWQSEHQYHPICNSVHQNDLTRFYVESNTGVGENLRLIASGYWRDVWKVPEREEGRQWVAVKTLRYKHAYSNRNFDRHRRDAVATERVSSSPYTVDIYAHCGHTMYSEFSTGGSLSDIIWPKEENTKRKKNSRNDGEKSSSALSMKERLALAIKAVRGLVAFQFPDDPKKASMSHTDITPSQFILVDGTLKLVSAVQCSAVSIV